VVPVCTTSVSIPNSKCFPQNIYVFSTGLRKNIDLFLYKPQRPAFVTNEVSVYCAVRPVPLNRMDYVLSLNGRCSLLFMSDGPKRIAIVFKDSLIRFLFVQFILQLFSAKTIWFFVVGVACEVNYVFICRPEIIEFLDQVADCEQIWKPLTYWIS
jgi:hypothetical protein